MKYQLRIKNNATIEQLINAGIAGEDYTHIVYYDKDGIIQFNCDAYHKDELREVAKVIYRLEKYDLLEEIEE